MSDLLVSGVGGTVLSVLLAILILLAMICVHEFGHFIAGRILGFKINEFAVGFGPKIFKRRGKKHGTLFSVRAFPLGGFCAFQGEDGEEADSDSFNSKKPWKRIIVLVSGALFNYLLALLLIIVGFFSFGQPCYKMGAIVESETYAAEYSLREGDVILGVQGKAVYFATDLIFALKGKSEGDGVTFDIMRGGNRQSAEVVLRADCDFNNSSEISKLWRALGSDTYQGADGNLYWSVTAQNCRFSFFTTIGRSFAYSFKTMGTIFRVLGELLTGSLGLSAMGGPVTTIRQTGEIAVQGLQSFLQVAAYIGVNLAVFNLLPIPALDGSKVIFCLIEWIFKKPVPRKVEAVIHAIGFVLILGFAVLVDIMQFARC
ncbi:MAG: site-2 protease family protein [Roseburia sp.]|nr:site-2 protease family protein [Roseburia sp.]